MGTALNGTGPALRSFYLQPSFVFSNRPPPPHLRLQPEVRTTSVSLPVAPSRPIGSIYASPPALAPPVQPLAVNVPAPPAFQACFRVVSRVTVSEGRKEVTCFKDKFRNRRSVLAARPGVMRTARVCVGGGASVGLLRDERVRDDFATVLGAYEHQEGPAYDDQPQ